MNADRTKLGITYFGLGALCVVAVVIVTLFAPEQAGEFTKFIGTIMGIASTGALSLILLTKQGEAVQRIESQTNGTLSRLTAERDAAVAEAERLRRSGA